MERIIAEIRKLLEEKQAVIFLKNLQDFHKILRYYR